MQELRTIEAFQVGDAAEIGKTISESDIYGFAGLTGDFNPAHVNEQYASQSPFKTRIAHGMFGAGLISAVIGMRLPGPGSIYLSQELKFLRPVRIGDTLTARVEVLEVLSEKNRLKLRTTCANQEGELVIDGVALVMPPKA